MLENINAQLSNLAPVNFTCDAALLSSAPQYSPVANRTLVANVYIDPTANSGGNGTIAAPFQNFRTLQTLTGDQGGFTIYLRSGAKIRDQLAINGASNFKVASYGGANYAAISAADLIPLSALTVEPLVVAGANVYSIPAATVYFPGTSNDSVVAGGNLTTALSKCVYVNGTTRFMAQKVLANLAVGQQFESGGKIYFKVAVPLSLADTVEVSCRNFCLTLVSVENVTVRGIYASMAANSNIAVNAITAGGNVLVQCNKTEYAGNYGTNNSNTIGARDGIVVYGNSTTPRTGVKIIGNESNFNHNNSLEIWGLNGAALLYNIGRSNGQGIEIWGHVINSTMALNIFSDNLGSLFGLNSQGCGIWQTPYNVNGDLTTGKNTGNTIAYNVFDGFADRGIKLQDGSASVYQNTVIARWISVDAVTGPNYQHVPANADACILVDQVTSTDPASYAIKNNVFISLAAITTFGSTTHDFCNIGVVGTVNNTTFVVDMDSNHWWAPNKVQDTFPANQLVMVLNNSGRSSLAQFRTALQAIRPNSEANSFLEDPGLVNYLPGQYLLKSTGAAAKFNGPHPGLSGLGYALDLAQAQVHTPPSRGAYE